MKQIPLTQGKFAVVDDDDFDYLSQFKWHVKKSRHTEYAMRGHDNEPMHRIIMNTPQKMEVDHINHNGLDNQKDNLRNVTTSQNQMNVNVTSRNKLGVKGVCMNGKKYRAHIEINQKAIHLGDFTTLEEAQQAYAKKAKELFGNYTNVDIGAK